MPDPSEYLRPCQIERGVLDIHDAPTTMAHGALTRYIDSGGRKRDAMKRARAATPRHYDLWLTVRESSRVIDLDGLVLNGHVYRKA